MNREKLLPASHRRMKQKSESEEAASVQALNRIT